MNYKFRCLVTAPPILPKIFNYKDKFDENSVEIVVPPYRVIESLNENQLLKLLYGIDGILCGDDSLNKRVLGQAKELKVISKWGTGIDSIDKKFAISQGIKVLRVKDIFSEPVSDTVLAYILLFARRIIEKHYLVKNNKWGKVESYTLKESSLGIIGVGHIGKLVARKVSALGMNVFGYDINGIPEDFIRETGIKSVDLETVLRKSDYITLHCDLNESTMNMIGKTELKLMKKNSVIINTSRGEIINQKDLEKALSGNIIFGAALDVFEVEPLPSSSVLTKMNNVLLSPHNSNASPMIFNRVDEASINNLISGLNE